MTPVAIRAGNHQYEALVGPKLIDTFGQKVAAKIGAPACAIISDSNVAPLLADRVDKSLLAAGFQPTLITIPAGEKSKTLERAGAICDQMIGRHLDRHSFVVGLGGGLVGDISGFVPPTVEARLREGKGI